MFRFLRLEDEMKPLTYAIVAPALVLSQHLLVWAAFRLTNQQLIADGSFWLLPMRRLSMAHGLPMWVAGLAFAFSLTIGWILAILSLRRAAWSQSGYALAGLTVVPGLQIGAVVLLVFMAHGRADAAGSDGRLNRSHLLHVLPASVAIATAIAASSIRGLDAYPFIVVALPASIPLLAVLCAAFPPIGGPPPASIQTPSEKRRNMSHVVQGVVAGVAVIVSSVFLSAVTLGAYGWGLFVMTPFVVGIVTAYLANRQVALPPGRTTPLVLGAAALGSLALITFALEGLVCVLLASPLGALVAAGGGHIGRAIAVRRQGGSTPLMSVALLPAIFAAEAATPPAAPIAMTETIDVAAPPSTVWRALTSGQAVSSPPGLIFRAGLAYPIRSRLVGEGVGATRIGMFSTGIARERVTEWVPERRLAFTLLTQPPAMREMSPYRKVHAPHVLGYFETRDTGFTLQPLSGGATRLTVRASHILRIDPALYWEPMARWAIHANVSRVLEDIKAKAERTPTNSSTMDRRPEQRY